MEPVPADTHSIRHVHLTLTTSTEKGILMPILQKSRLRLQEDLIFWVPLGTPSGCLFVALWHHSQPSLLHEHLGHSLHAHGFSSDKLSSPHPARLSSSPAHSMGLSPAGGPSSLPPALAWAAIHSLWTLQSSPTPQAVSSHSQT